jgi:hypothetical protein
MALMAAIVGTFFAFIGDREVAVLLYILAGIFKIISILEQK